MTNLLLSNPFNLACIALTAAFSTSAQADIAVPPCAEQLIMADVVAVGKVVITEGEASKVTFVASSIVKGEISVNKSYPVDSPSVEIRNTIPQIVTITNDKPFMLVAKKDPHSLTLWPIYGTSSVWPSPQSEDLPEDYRKPNTLEECVALATSILKEGNVNLPESEFLEKLKTINKSLPDRMVDPASPEGIFLGSLPKKKPFSHDVMNQLILMVDIEEKAPSTKERPSLTANSPCVRALISARAQSIEPIKDALKREDLLPKVRTILEELETLIPKVIAADERRKARDAQRARPTPSNPQ